MRPKTCPPAGSLFPPVKHLPVLISDTLLDCQTPCPDDEHPGEKRAMRQKTAPAGSLFSRLPVKHLPVLMSYTLS